MRDFVIGAVCFVFGVGIMGLFCDWMFVESQRCLDESRQLHENAIALARAGGDRDA